MILGWSVAFEAIWPRYKSRIAVVERNIERHATLMNTEVSLADITDAQRHRALELEEDERTQQFQQRQDFEDVQSHICPRLYDNELYGLQERSCSNTGDWLQKEGSFCEWIDPNDKSTRLLWLQGIPGAGKLLSQLNCLFKSVGIYSFNITH